MTKINDYLWHLPHALLPDDPPDVAVLQQSFNLPIADSLEGPLGELGYQLKSNDVMVKLDERLDRTADTYYANVRFIAYMESDIILRVHFEHTEWATILADHDVHQYFINLDRFKVQDPRTQVVVPAWSGRLHSRMTNRPGDRLHHTGEDQIWAYKSAEELEAQIQLFLEKFDRMGHAWLADRATL
jgi:hypothetical protein